MNANELRIGNWVYLPTAGENFEQQVRHVGLESVNGFDLEECDPIPITEEVLLKCGFEHHHDSTYVLYSEHISIDILRNDINWDDDFNCGGIEYVHQLQNLFFAAAHRELPIEL